MQYPWPAVGPGRATSGRPTLQTSSNQHDLNRLAKTSVTNVVNLSPKTSIFTEKADGLTTFVTTGQKSTRKTPWIDDVCNNTRRATRQHNRPHWCGGRRRDRRARPRCRWATAGTGRASRRREGLAAVPVGGGRAWPGFETTRRAKLAARTASGRAAAHGHTKQPGPQDSTRGARNTSGATSTTERRSLRTPRSTPGSGRPGGRRGGRVH